MEVLLTGNTSCVTKAWIEAAFPQDHVLIAGYEKAQDPHLKAIALDNKRLLSQLTDTYEFDCIVYFSQYLIPHNEQAGELERLRHVLQINRERPVRILYLAGPESIVTPETGKTIMAKAAEELCRHYAMTSQVQVKVLHMPYLYGTDGAGGGQGFAPLFEQMEAGKLCFDEQAQSPLYALCSEDLAELVPRIYDAWTPEWEEFTVPVVFDVNYSHLGEKLQQLCPGLQVSYGQDSPMYYPADDGLLRKRYGWFPRYALLDDMPELYGRWKEARTPKRDLLGRIWNTLRTRRRLLAAAEIAAAWLVTELLVQMTATQAQFRKVDFRLAFIVLVGTMYGLNAGVLAALLASLSLMLGYLQQGTTPLQLFYDPANWLAFIVYFIAGALCGYVQMQNAESIRFVQQENERLKDRLRFMRRLYQDTLEDKQMFRRQILGRKDSFGKIYDVTRQLDDMQPEKLYYKTVQIMEDVLQNKSLAVYHLDDNRHFARMMACSPGFKGNMPRSIETEQYLPVLRSIEQEGLWVNRELIPEMPMYAAAVRENGRAVVLVVLFDAVDDQLTLYYQNLFRILCGLAETALVRAFEYENAVYNEQHLPGTRVLRPAAFAAKLDAACTLKEGKMAQHLLLRVTDTFENETRLYAALDHAIRSSDAAGRGPDGSLYLLLNQAEESELPIIEQRLQKHGISAQPVPFEQQLALVAAATQEGEQR